MNKILTDLVKQANEFDKNGLRKEADRIDALLKKIAEQPRLYDLLDRKPSEQPGMGRQFLEQLQKANPTQQETPKQDEPQQAEKPKPKPKEALPYTKEQLLQAIKRDPSQEQAIRSHLVPALNEYVGGPEVSGSGPLDVYGPKPINQILDAADKLGMLKKQQSWFQKLF